MARSKTVRNSPRGIRKAGKFPLLHRQPLRLVGLEDRTTPSTFTWDDGGSTNNWSDAGNWVGNVAPTPADAGTFIVFNTIDSTSFMDIVGMDVAAIRFETGSQITLTLNTDLSIDGNTQTDSHFSDTTGKNSIVGNGKIILPTPPTFITIISTTSPTGALEISASFGGSSGFIKRGAGQLTLSTTMDNSYTGTTYIDEGTLFLDTSTSDRGLSGNIIVGDGTGAINSATLQLARDFEIPDGATLTINRDGRVNVPAGVTEDLTTLDLRGGRLNIDATGIFEIQTNGTVKSSGIDGSAINGTGRLRFEGGTITFDLAQLLDVRTPLSEASPSNLVKTGNSTLIFGMQSANTYTGSTFVDGGLFLLNGNSFNSALSRTIIVGDGTGAVDSARLHIGLNNSQLPNESSVTINRDGQVTVGGSLTEDVTNLILNGGHLNIGANSIFGIRTNGTVTATGESGSVIDGPGTLTLQSGSIALNVADGPGTTDLLVSTPISEITRSHLVKTGAGTLEFAMPSANTYTGTTFINDGALYLSTNTNTNNQGLSDTIFVGDGTGAANSAELRVEISGQIPDTAIVTVNADGFLGIGAGAVERIGGLNLSGGTVTLSNTLAISPGGSVNALASPTTSTINGPGLLQINADTTFTVADGPAARDLIINASIFVPSDKAYQVIKEGAGHLILNGSSTYIICTKIVNAGTLEINGSEPDSSVIVNGGALVGIGSIGTLTGTGGLISPNPVVASDKFTTKSVSLGATTYFANLISLTTYDQLAVTGSVNVAGCTLVTNGTFLYANGYVFKIIDNDGTTDPVTGTFVGLPEGATIPVNGRTLRISYVGGDGNDVTLTDVTPPPANSTPTVSDIVDQSSTGAAVGPLALTIGDLETPAANLTLTAVSSNPTLLPNANISLGGSDANRTIQVTPVAGQVGTATVTVTVTDAGGQTATDTFVLTVTAPPPANTPPTVSDVVNQSSNGAAVGPLAFTVGDAETPAANLTVTAVSSFQTVLPNANIVLAGSGADRTITVTPVAGQFGTATITVTVRDAGGLTATDTFVLTVTAPPPANTPPSISDVANQSSTGAATGPLAFTVGDAETPVANLTVTAVSSNPTLLPNANISLGGSGANRTITATPVTGLVGTATVTVTVRDAAGLTATDTFVLNVTASPTLVGSQQFAAGADVGGNTAVLFNPDGTVRFTLTPFPGQGGGVRTAVADFNGDGVGDLVLGTGPGGATHVKVFDGVTQSLLFAVDPFETAFAGGVHVAAGDLTGDGLAELVVTPDEGGGPRVRVFDGGHGFSQLADFYGIEDPNFRGGARAAVGDVNGDGTGDLIVVAGFGGGPRVATYDGQSLATAARPKLVPDFFAFDPSLRNGLNVAAGDVNGDGFADVIAGGGTGDGPRVFVLDGQSLMTLGRDTLVPIANFFSGNPDARGGIRVAVRDLDNDAKADIVTGSGAGGRVTTYLGASITPSETPPVAMSIDPFPGFAGGVFVG